MVYSRVLFARTSGFCPGSALARRSVLCAGSEFHVSGTGFQGYTAGTFRTCGVGFVCRSGWKNDLARQSVAGRWLILAENVCKWGSGKVWVTRNNPEDFARLSGFFDVLLIDAPCSGEGLFRKDPESVQEWSEPAVKLCAERQKRILTQVWDSLAEDGFLIYSTCTYSEAENEDILLWLQEAFEVGGISVPVLPEWGIVETQAGKLPGYRFFSHRLAGEGLFMAVLQKKSGKNAFHRKNRKSLLSLPSRKEKETVQTWVQNPEAGGWIKWNEKLLWLPERSKVLADRLLSDFRVVYAGLEAGAIFHEKINPLEGLALFSQVNVEAFSTQNLDLQTALQFLRKEEINVENPGWVLMQYENTPLGWMKKSGNKLTNHYPREWKLRLR
jgi:NOL1/NOP2/fmu family ribosome biogenesis protein